MILYSNFGREELDKEEVVKEEELERPLLLFVRRFIIMLIYLVGESENYILNFVGNNDIDITVDISLLKLVGFNKDAE